MAIGLSGGTHVLDEQTALELPLDHLRPPKDTYCGAMELFSFPAHISRSLERLSLEERSTMFMTVLAAFMTLLYRYTGQNKIAIGAPIANRNRAEVEGLIGFFTNTLVLCTEFGDNPTFRQLLGRVREMTIGAYAHEDLPFERLVEELNPERNLHINPLFQVMLVLQKATGVFPTLSPDQADSDAAQSPANTVAKFDLTLYMEETEQGLIGGLEYATELFDRSTIQRMLKHFRWNAFANGLPTWTRRSGCCARHWAIRRRSSGSAVRRGRWRRS